jgi:hypothetical protein
MNRGTHRSSLHEAARLEGEPASIGDILSPYPLLGYGADLAFGSPPGLCGSWIAE